MEVSKAMFEGRNRKVLLFLFGGLYVISDRRLRLESGVTCISNNSKSLLVDETVTENIQFYG